MMEWVVELGEHKIEYQPRKTIKRQALVDFFAETYTTPKVDSTYDHLKYGKCLWMVP